MAHERSLGGILLSTCLTNAMTISTSKIAIAGLVCALSIGCQNTVTISCPRDRVSQHDPIFIGASFTNSQSFPVRTYWTLKSMLIERLNSKNEWVKVPRNLSAQVARFPGGSGGGGEIVPILAPGKEVAHEVMTWDPDLTSATGRVRFSVSAMIQKPGTGVRERIDSPWLEVEVVASAQNDSLMSNAQHKLTVSQLFACGFGAGRMPWQVVDISSSSLESMLNQGAEGSLRDLICFARAEQSLRLPLRGMDPTNPSVPRRVSSANANLRIIDTSQYSGSFGGLGAHTLYLRSFVAWFQVDTLAELNDLDPRLTALDAKHPKDKLAHSRQNGHTIRPFVK